MIPKQSRISETGRVDGKYPTILTIDKIQVLQILENIKKLIEHDPEIGMNAINGCIEGLTQELKENKEIQ